MFSFSREGFRKWIFFAKVWIVSNTNVFRPRPNIPITERIHISIVEDFFGPYTRVFKTKKRFCVRNSVSHTCLEIFDLVEFQLVLPTSIYLSSHISMWSSILPSPLKKYVWHYSTVSQEKTKIIGYLHSFPYTMNVFKQIASELQIECVMRTTLQIFLDKSSVPHCRQEFFIDKSSVIQIYKNSITSIWQKFIKPQIKAENMYNSNWAWKSMIY